MTLMHLPKGPSDSESPPAEFRRRLLSRQVAGARYVFLDLAPGPGTGWSLALAGREVCATDYLVDRTGYPFHVVECVAAGRGSIRLGRGQTQPIGPGSVYAYTSSMPCWIRTDPSAPLVKYFFALAGREAPSRLSRAGLAPGLVRRLDAPAQVLGIAEDVIREGQRHRSRTQAICLKLLELFLLKVADIAEGSRERGERSRQNFLRCKAYIEAHADEPATLRNLAAALGLDPSSICRLFRRFEGSSPYRFLLQRKMALAAEYLVDTGGLVKEAAFRVGFSDPYHFARCFKAVHGIPPSKMLQYRPKMATGPVRRVPASNRRTNPLEPEGTARRK